jgi:hypothetical protein
MLTGSAWADSTVVPDLTITPGAVRVTDTAEICSHGTRQLRHWDRQREDRIMAKYGLPLKTRSVSCGACRMRSPRPSTR